jgi:uncharacterized membrane protein (UPF0127 family)
LHVRPPAGGALRLAVAERFALRLLGLGGLRILDRGYGLLIPRCSCVHTLGMRFSIDLVFLVLDREARTGRVLEVSESVPPLRVARARARPARCGRVATIELAAGEAGRLGLRPGATLALEDPCY